MTVTIREVARAAGVSVATVSRVLNESGPVSDEARRRVRAAAGELRYTPHGAARSLITSRTHTVGVILPDLYGEFFSEVIRGLDQAARRHAHHLLVSGSHADESELGALIRAMRGRVDGLIVMSPDVEAAALLGHLPVALPVVLLNCADSATTLPALRVDSHGGAVAMVRHLLALGHRRIALIAGAERNHDALERQRGYREALAEAGVAARAEYEVPGDFTEDGGHAAARRLLALAEPPTAVFAANDAMAVGAMSAFREAGVRVPHDVAIGGFDDIPLARHLDPPLTSVHADIAALGARAVDLVLAAADERPSSLPPPELLPTTLVVRASCGAAAMPAPPDGRARVRMTPPPSVETRP